MSFSHNPSVEEVVPANGLAVGFKGGRPPDEVVVVDGVNILERSGSPVPEVVQPMLQPMQKRGKNLEEAMLIDDESGKVAAEGLNAPSVPSFKDKLVGSKVVSSTARSLSNLDVDVKEDDVRIGGSSILPEIQFSDRVHNQVDAQLAMSVIVRLLGKSIGYRALLNRVKSLWNPNGDMCIIDLDNDYYLVRFAIEEDFQKVLSEGPWVIYGSYLTVQPWSREFSTSEAHPSHIRVWVRLPKLPYRYYTKSMFRHIANAIGKVVRVDYNTSEGKRGRFARLAILVDLRKPLVSGIVIDGHRQDIEYEGLPEICFKCGKVGHSKEMCPGENVDMSLKVAEGEQRKPTEPYGPWMQVVNQRRRQGVAIPNRDPREGNELGGEGVVSAQPEEQVVGAAWKGREVLGGGRGRVRIISRSPSPKKDEADRSKEANTGDSGAECVREVGARLKATSLGRETPPVAAQGMVVPVKSALGTDKHAVVKVVDAGEGLNPKQVKNRVLSSSIRGSTPRGSFKKGHGHTVNSKLGVKQTKRDDRGQVNPVVHSSLAELVTDLERAEAAVKDSGIGLNDGSEDSDVHRQWRVNSVFEQPGLSDMQGALDPVVARSFKLLCRSKVPDIVAIFEPQISGGGAADRFIRRSGFTFSFRVEARGFSGGIWILWKDSVKIDILAVSNQFVHGHCVPLNGEPGFHITFIYASPEVGRRRSLWPQLKALEPEQGIPWILGGDLNVIAAARGPAVGLSTVARWTTPPRGWLKCNIDAAVCVGNGSAAVGGVVRDDMGDWVLGFHRYIGRCSVLMAELWAMYDGLRHAWEAGFRNIEFESDNKEVVHICNGTSSTFKDSILVVHIVELLQRDWRIHVKHVSRSCNTVADLLAKLGQQGSMQGCRFATPPAAIASVVAEEQCQGRVGLETAVVDIEGSGLAVME
ncbi:hypothetical protein GQ457_02G023990 [Hibiscus cannabinus]